MCMTYSPPCAIYGKIYPILFMGYVLPRQPQRQLNSPSWTLRAPLYSSTVLPQTSAACQRPPHRSFVSAKYKLDGQTRTRQR